MNPILPSIMVDGWIEEIAEKLHQQSVKFDTAGTDPSKKGVTFVIDLQGGSAETNRIIPLRSWASVAFVMAKSLVRFRADFPG